MKPALIDTDILSYYFKGHETVIQNFTTYLADFSAINISIITYYEILSGLTYKKAHRQIQDFEKFATANNLLEINTNTIKRSADIYANLRSKGVEIGNLDILISGIALAHDLVLVTNNVKHF